VLGRSPVARALARLGGDLGYAVDVFAPGAPAEDFPGARQVLDSLDLTGYAFGPLNALVVASQGEYDEEALAAALATPWPYVAFVASRKKWQAVREGLRARGIAPERLAAVKAPAGLDLHGEEAEEVALSILAEIVTLRRTGALATAQAGAAAETPAAPTQAVDPICGMTVDVKTARAHSHHAGRDYYFCCPGCKRTFDGDPARYLKAG
jgi:xanthine dehydrogenase accessory factor